jgi:hypothetical protein
MAHELDTSHFGLVDPEDADGDEGAVEAKVQSAFDGFTAVNPDKLD